MSGRRILNDQQIDIMAALREKGWSYERIARRFTASGTPISPGSIGWQCLRVGADIPIERRRPIVPNFHLGRGKSFTPDEDSRLLSMERDGLKLGQIAKALDRRENSIRGRLMTLARHQARAEDASA